MLIFLSLHLRLSFGLLSKGNSKSTGKNSSCETTSSLHSSKITAYYATLHSFSLCKIPSALPFLNQVDPILYFTPPYFWMFILTLILPRSRTGTVWFYTSTSNKTAARPKLNTKSLTRDLKRMYSRLTLVRISINL